MSPTEITRSPGGKGRRIAALVKKEFLQIVRDPSSIALAFVMPVVLLVLFGYGVNLDARHVRIGVVIERPTSVANDFFSVLVNSHYFAPRLHLDRPAAEDAVREGRTKGYVVLREDFAARVEGGGNGAVQVILNGTDSNTANLLTGYLNGAWQTWLVQRGYRLGTVAAPLIGIEQRVWFNPEVRSRNFIVPGLVALVMMLIGAFLTALVIAREWERGTMEALLTQPITAGEILIGKIVPYFTLGMGGMVISVMLAIFVFEVPFRGSPWVLLVVSVAFLLAALGFGLFISTVTRNQFVASQAAIVATFLPTFLLSGFLFDINSMPGWIQVITYAVPARYYIAIVQSLFLAGDEWSVILPNLAALVGIAAFFLGLTRRKTRKVLD